MHRWHTAACWSFAFGAVGAIRQREFPACASARFPSEHARKPALPGPCRVAFSAFEMPAPSRYHLLCGMVRADRATSSATPSDRSPRSATGSLTKRPRRYTRGAPCRARAHGHGVKESSGSPLRRNDALRDGTLIFAHLRRCAYQCELAVISVPGLCLLLTNVPQDRLT